MSAFLKYLLCCLLFLKIHVFSQNENRKWCFGTSAGLDFMTSPPTPFNAAFIGASDGSASVADALGNLLFYTNGQTVWNKNHTPMANGTGIPVAGPRGVLIAKQPGSPSLYYIFISGGSGLNYAIVDMSLAAGMGSVTIKYAVLTTTAQTSKIAGVFPCNYTDMWIVSQDNALPTFRAYLLTASGINTTPVISNTGFVNAGPGQLKFSPDGSKLASTDNGATIQMYSFNGTGVISNLFQIGSLGNSAYGVEFSPDGSKLYATCYGLPHVFQFDLCAGPVTPSSISASQYTVASLGSTKRAIQLGMDGKLYISRPGTNALAVINNPDLPGAACNYVETGQSIAPNFCLNDLPNYIKRRPAPILTHSFTPSSCSTVSFATKGAWNGIVNCATNSATVLWIFGDPASGSANTSNLYNATHVYPGPGTYTVKLVFNYFCGADTTWQAITIAAGPTLNVSGNLNLCEGQSTTLTASGANSYTWTGNGPAQTGSVLVANPPGSGSPIYTVTGDNSSGCPGIATVTLTVLPKPVLTVNGNTVVCAGSNATLTASGAPTYTWNNGSNASTIIVPSANAAYQVSGTGQNGCVNTVTVMISSQALPTISVNNATTCPGNPVPLAALGSPSSGVIYSWLPGGQSGSTITVSPSSTGIYSVTGSLNGCSSTATNMVTVNPLAESITLFSYSNPVCMSQNLSLPQLAAGFSQGGSFLSSAGIALDQTSGQIDPKRSEPGTYQVTYTLSQVACTAGGLHTAQVLVLPVPVLTLSPSIKIAPGESATLSVSGGESYSWEPSADLSCSDCESPVVSPSESKVYCVSSTEGPCKASACIYVEVNCDTGFDFSVPNAFTPDGNGRNESFCLQGWSACIKSFEVLVFNRWGELVFRSNDPKFCWDGRYKGEQLGTDVFVYQISATYQDNKIIRKKGNISLFR